jgi:hypothetical protein
MDADTLTGRLRVVWPLFAFYTVVALVIVLAIVLVWRLL